MTALAVPSRFSSMVAGWVLSGKASIDADILAGIEVVA